MVLRRLAAAAALLLPAAAGGQVLSYSVQQTIGTSGNAERLFVLDAEGDGDLDIYVGPRDGSSIDFLELPGPTVRGPLALGTDDWAPFAADTAAPIDLAFVRPFDLNVYVTRLDINYGALPPDSTLPGGDFLSAVEPLRHGANSAFAFCSPASCYWGDFNAPFVWTGSIFASGTGLRTGDTNADGVDEVFLLQSASNALMVVNTGPINGWAPATDLGVPGPHLDAAAGELGGPGRGGVALALGATGASVVLIDAGIPQPPVALAVPDARLVTVLDADMDGDDDLAFVATVAGAPAVQVWLNDGTGAFTAGTATALPAGMTGNDLAAGDLDLRAPSPDGKPEVVVAGGGVSNQVVVLEAGNLPPVVDSLVASASSAPEGTPITLTATASGPETDQTPTLTFAWQRGIDSIGVNSSPLATDLPPSCQASGPTPVTYSVVVTDSLGLTSAPAFVTVNVDDGLVETPPQVTVTPSGAVTDLDGGTATLTAAVTDTECPTGPFTYRWTPDAGSLLVITPTPDPAVVTVSSSASLCGSQTVSLSLEVTDPEGELSTTSVLVDVGDSVVTPPTADVARQDALDGTPVDEGTTGVFRATGSDTECPAGSFTYVWSVDSGPIRFVSGESTNTVTIEALGGQCNPAGASLSLTVTDAELETGFVTVPVPIRDILRAPGAPVVTDGAGVTPTTIDEGSTLALTAVSTPGDCPASGLTYTWTATGDLTVAVDVSDPRLATITAGTVCGAGTGTLTVTATHTDEGGSPDTFLTLSVLDTVPQAPDVAISPPDPFLADETLPATITASLVNSTCGQADTYVWAAGPELVVTPDPGDPLRATVLAASDECGERSSSVTVTATGSSGSDSDTRAVTILDSIPDTAAPAVTLAAVEGNPGAVGADGALVVEASGTDNCPGALSGFAFEANRPDGSDASDLVELLPVEPPDPARRRVRNRTCSDGQAVLAATAQDAAAAPNVGRSAPLPLTLVASPPEITLAQGREVIPRALQASGATVELHAALSCSDPGDQVCFEQLEGPVAALLSADGATSEPGCGRADRVLSIAPKEVPAFLPPYNVLQLEATLVAAGGSTVRAGPAAVEIRLVPDDDLLALVHRADRGRAGPGETVGLEVEIASTLVAPIALEVTLLDALDGLLYVEGSAVGDGVEVVADRATDGGAAIVVTGIPAKGQTAKVRYLAQRSIASEGAITSEVVAFAADSPLSPRAGANAGDTLLTAPGIACACTEGEGTGSAAGVLPWLTLAALALHRRRSRPT